VCPAGGWYPGGKEERATLRFFRASRRQLKATVPLLPRIAAVPSLRRVAFRELMARPGQVDAEGAMAFFTGAANCSVFDAAIALAASGEAFGELAPIDVPVRILYGTRDRLIRWPDYYLRMKELLPSAEFVALEGLGHIPMWDDPDQVTRRILEVSAPDAVGSATA
jgi:pimeloyl-ACP methyl ester carboxylesterase